MKKFMFSEFLHAKAINIIDSYFDKNPILSHLTNSFLKNFQQA